MQILRCGPCNVKFRAKLYAASKTYKCPRCGRRLEAIEVPTGARGPRRDAKTGASSDEQLQPKGRHVT